MSAPTANRPASAFSHHLRTNPNDASHRPWWLPPLLTNLGSCSARDHSGVLAATGWKILPFDAAPTAVRRVLASPGATGHVWFAFSGWIPLCSRLDSAHLLLLPQGLPSVWQVAESSPTGSSVKLRLPLIVSEHSTGMLAVSLINTYDDRGISPPSGFGFGLGNVMTINGSAVGTPSQPSARHRRSAQAFLQAPSAILDLDTGRYAQYLTHAIAIRWTLGVTDAYHGGASGSTARSLFIG